MRRFNAIICNRTNDDKRHFLIVDDTTSKMEEVSPRLLRILPDLIVLAIAAAVQSAGAWWLLRTLAATASRRARLAIVGGTALSVLFIAAAFLARFARFGKLFSYWWVHWGRGLALAWILLSSAWLAALIVLRVLARWRGAHSPARRQFLRGAQAVAFAAPLAAGYGVFVRRNQFTLREHKIAIANLPPDLEGLRLVQITDIHLSPFLSRSDLEHAIAMANETQANIALVTGDLITSAGDPLDDCLDALRALRSEAGVFGCLGNHEVYTGTQDYSEREGARRGIRFLRRNSAALRFGKATLNLAGVDY